MLDAYNKFKVEQKIIRLSTLKGELEASLNGKAWTDVACESYALLTQITEDLKNMDFGNRKQIRIESCAMFLIEKLGDAVFEIDCDGTIAWERILKTGRPKLFEKAMDFFGPDTNCRWSNDDNGQLAWKGYYAFDMLIKQNVMKSNLFEKKEGGKVVGRVYTAGCPDGFELADNNNDVKDEYAKILKPLEEATLKSKEPDELWLEEQRKKAVASTTKEPKTITSPLPPTDEDLMNAVPSTKGVGKDMGGYTLQRHPAKEKEQGKEAEQPHRIRLLGSVAVLLMGSMAIYFCRDNLVSICNKCIKGLCERFGNTTGMCK